MFIPEKARQMTTPLYLYTAKAERVNGVLVKAYKLADNPLILCNFASYGGTEIIRDGVFSVDDTAQIVTWYRPDITSSCRLERLSDHAFYEVIGEPENLEMRNQIVSFRVRRLKGGV